MKVLYLNSNTVLFKPLSQIQVLELRECILTGLYRSFIYRTLYHFTILLKPLTQNHNSILLLPVFPTSVLPSSLWFLKFCLCKELIEAKMFIPFSICEYWKKSGVRTRWWGEEWFLRAGSQYLPLNVCLCSLLYLSSGSIFSRLNYKTTQPWSLFIEWNSGFTY